MQPGSLQNRQADDAPARRLRSFYTRACHRQGATLAALVLGCLVLAAALPLQGAGRFFNTDNLPSGDGAIRLGITHPAVRLGFSCC